MRLKTDNFLIGIEDCFSGIREGYYSDGEICHEFIIDCGMIIGFVPSEVSEALRNNGLVS